MTAWKIVEKDGKNFINYLMDISIILTRSESQYRKTENRLTWNKINSREGIILFLPYPRSLIPNPIGARMTL